MSRQLKTILGLWLGVHQNRESAHLSLSWHFPRHLNITCKLGTLVACHDNSPRSSYHIFLHNPKFTSNTNLKWIVKKWKFKKSYTEHFKAIFRQYLNMFHLAITVSICCHCRHLNDFSSNNIYSSICQRVGLVKKMLEGAREQISCQELPKLG